MDENNGLGCIKMAATESLGKHGLILIAAKVIRCLGIFESYDLLKVIHIVTFIFFLNAWFSIVYTLVHKPISSGKRISKHQWIRVIRYTLFGLVIDLLWFFGLTLCGPLRTILVFEHSETIVLAMLTGIFSPSGNHSKTRGAILFVGAIICLLLFDNDDMMSQISDQPEGQHAGTISQAVYWFISILGVADHKGGILLLLITLLLKVGHSVMGKKLSMDISGAKRLQALSTVTSVVLLTPWVLIIYISGSSGASIFSFIVPFTLIVMTSFVFNFYVDSFFSSKQFNWKSSQISYVTISLFALFLAYHWQHPAAVAMSQIHQQRAEARTHEHVLSGGVVISALLFIWSSFILSRPASLSQKGNFIGYSSDGLPLYSFAGDALKKASQWSLAIASRTFLSKVLQKRDSRHIFYFLCLNLTFAFVELTYGIWSNSLGLVSDSFHMMFDCTALVLGLLASVMSQWKPTRAFPFGYGRVEVLSGYVNGLFLTVVASSLILEAFQRLFDPPKIDSEQLLAVSIIGFLVNLIGVVLFSHNHHHSGNCSHDEHHHHDHQNSNLRGVYLHIVADLLGSIGVIVSSFLIGQYKLFISDPVCTLLIGILILSTVWPLLRDSARVLVLRVPVELEKDIQKAMMKIQQIEGVVMIRSRHIWRHSEKEVTGLLSVQVSPHVIEQRIISQVTPILKEAGITLPTIQVMKEDFYQHMSGLSDDTNEILKSAQAAVYMKEQTKLVEDDYAKLV